MANLILNKTKEIEIVSETKLKGEWKLEIVCPNGEIKKPFGDKMRSNLLLKQGLEMLGGTKYPESGSIAQFMIGAMYGNNPASQSRTIYTTTNGIPMIQNDNQTGMFGWSTYNSTNDCLATPLAAQGAMLFRKTYDFLAVANTQTVTEIIIFGGNGIQTQQRNTNTLSGGNVLSRFILPSPVTLSQYQFLRLTYSLQVSMPSTLNYENVNVESGDFSGYGRLIRVGTFPRIFGSMSAAGSPVTYSNIDGAAYRQPWLMISSTGATAIFLNGGDINGTQQPPPPIGPNIDWNGNSILTGDGGSSISTAVHTDGVGGEIVDEGFSNNELSLNKRARVLFPATNPIETAYIGGIFITPRGSIIKNPTQTDYQGWYWQFTDLNGQPRGQLKDLNFALVINFRQTSSIT